MAGDGQIDMAEWGTFTQIVRGLETGFSEMRAEFRELSKNIGKRCSDCNVWEAARDLRDRMEKVDDRLRYLEIKVAGIAVVSGIASAVIVHVLTKR